MIDTTVQIPSEFAKRDDIKAWFYVICNALVVAFSGAVAWHIDTWWAYTLAFILVGARGQACYILQHEAMHNLLFTNIKLNEHVGIALSALLGTQFYSGRKMHWDHHLKVGTHEDPNHPFHDVSQRPPGIKMIAFFLSHLMGARLIGLAKNLLAVVAGFIQNKPTGEKLQAAPQPTPQATSAIPAKKARIDIVALLSVQLGMLVVLSLISSPWVYVLLYVLPLSTLTAFFELTRSFSEHVLPGTATCDAEERRCFFMDAGRIEQFFISQFDFHYHQVHHLYPNVVTFKVRALHEWLLANDPSYPAKFKTRPGYVGTALRYISNQLFAGAGNGFPIATAKNAST